MYWPFRLTRRLFLALTGSAVVVLRPASPSGKGGDESTLSGEAILQKMGEAYRKCKTYQDSGTCVKVFRGRFGTRTYTRPFTTAFIRPDRIHFVSLYRFREQMAWRHNIVWASGSDVRWWWAAAKETPGPPTRLTEKPTSIVRALQGAAGIGSVDAAMMLLPGQKGEWWRLTELTELRRLDNARLGDVDCFRVEGRRVHPSEVNPAEKERERREVRKLVRESEQRGDKHVFRPPDPDTVKHSPRVLWIDRVTFLLRRIDESTQFEDFRTESTTTYEPLLDAPVSEEQLAFKEPVYPDPPLLQLEPAPDKPDEPASFIPFVSQSTVQFTGALGHMLDFTSN